MDEAGRNEPRGILGDRGRFILIWGVLVWGLLTAILFSLWKTYDEGFSPGWYLSARFFRHLILAVIMFGIGGWFWGACMWKAMRKFGQHR